MAIKSRTVSAALRVVRRPTRAGPRPLSRCISETGAGFTSYRINVGLAVTRMIPAYTPKDHDVHTNESDSNTRKGRERPLTQRD